MTVFMLYTEEYDYGIIDVWLYKTKELAEKAWQEKIKDKVDYLPDFGIKKVTVNE